MGVDRDQLENALLMTSNAQKTLVAGAMRALEPLFDCAANGNYELKLFVDPDRVRDAVRELGVNVGDRVPVHFISAAHLIPRPPWMSVSVFGELAGGQSWSFDFEQIMVDAIQRTMEKTTCSMLAEFLPAYDPLLGQVFQDSLGKDLEDALSKRVKRILSHGWLCGPLVYILGAMRRGQWPAGHTPLPYIGLMRDVILLGWGRPVPSKADPSQTESPLLVLAR